MNPPANWYPDPTGRHGQRYWDGEQWTEHVFTDGVQGVDPLEHTTPVAEDVEPATDHVEPATEDLEPAAEDVESAAEDGEGQRAVAGDASWAVADEEEAADDVEGSAAGLFEDAGGEDTWTPDEAEAAGSGEVAPDVESEDVVASLDEVAEPGTTTDMSDAFVLAPETASRIVHRRGAGTEGGDEPSPTPAPAADTGSIDAPPPSVPAAAPREQPATARAGLGISGDLLAGDFAERSEAGPVALQNNRMLRCAITADTAVVARQGTMVAYQGEVSFDRQGAGGVTRALKRAATGEGLAMMRVEGSGDVFFADGAQHVFVLQLEGGSGLSVNGRNVLAFSADLDWDIQRVKGATLLAGGLFNTTFTGTGWVALVSDGEPVVLRTDEAPTHVDVNALVAWSGGLSTRVVNSVSAKSLVGLGSGEAFQMAFDGTGVVIVQPSEGPLAGAAAAT